MDCKTVEYRAVSATGGTIDEASCVCAARYREECGDGGGAYDDELTGVIIVLK